MLDVLEHRIDPVGALRRVHPMLASDGLLVLSTINASGLHARVSSKRWPWVTRPHIHYPGPVQLALMLRRAGFEMVRWQLMPRSTQLSYIAERAGNQPGAAALGRASQVFDPRLPAGLLGDSALICARPSRRGRTLERHDDHVARQWVCATSHPTAEAYPCRHVRKPAPGNRVT